MPTVYNRVYAIHKNQKKPMLNPEQRFELGLLIREEFKKTGKGHFAKVKANPYDFDGMVNYYPKEFRERMDEMIFKYHSDPASAVQNYLKTEAAV